MNQSTQQQVLLQREGKPSFESPVSLVSRRGEGRAFESRIATQWMVSMCAPKDGRVLTSWGSSFLHTRTRFGETTPVPQRRRIAVLVSPKMTELGRWKTDFVRARLDFFSQDYVPAVLGVPASSLEGRLTRDLLSTFSSGFTTNEETITTLVGESILGRTHAINSVHDTSLVWDLFPKTSEEGTPSEGLALLVVPKTGDPSLSHSYFWEDPEQVIAGLLVLEGLTTSQVRLSVHVE